MEQHNYWVRRPDTGWMQASEMFYFVCLSAMDADPVRYEGWQVCRVMSRDAVTA